MAFTIETIRPGVQFTPRAARSFRRFEHRLGRRADVNSTYRDRDKQMQMYRAWQAWVNGTGPKPWHSRAVHPKYSIHCQGNALDSDDWTTPGFVALAAEHGWIRTAASDPTERHHFEYQSWRDQHINDPAPTSTDTKPEPEEELPMNVKLYLHKPTNKLLLVDHLNMRIRDLGADNNLERQKFDRLPYVTVQDKDWTAMFAAWPYVERDKAIRMVSV